MPDALVEQLGGDPHEVLLGDHRDDVSVLDDGQAADALLAHDRDGVDGERVGRDGEEVASHDVGDRDAVVVGAALRCGAAGTRLRERGEVPEHRARGHEADEHALRVLDRDVAHALPAHEVGDELDGVVGLHGEEVRLHVLRDLVVAGAGAVELVEPRALPLDDGTAGLLAGDRRGDERVEALALRAARLHALRASGASSASRCAASGRARR